MTPNRFTHNLKGRLLYAGFVLAMPVVLVCGYLWWTGEIRFQQPKSAGPHPPTSVKPSPPPPRELPMIAQEDLAEQLERVREEVGRLRAAQNVPRATLGMVLLRRGDLERAIGDSEAGEAALREVVALHTNASHWQVREASRRLEDVQALAERGAADQERWREAFQRQRQAEALHAQGKYLKGVTMAEEAWKLRRELWGPEHAEVAESLLRRAWLCTEHADFYVQSRKLALEAAEAARQTVGEEHPLYGDCLFVRATLADDRGSFREADRFYDEARAVYEDSVGKLSRAYARALSRQGRMHEVWWKPLAESKLLDAQDIRRQILDEDDPDRAESLEFLAQSLYRARAFSRAEVRLSQALEIRRNVQGENHPDLARPKSLWGACRGMNGDSSWAMVQISEALDLTDRLAASGTPSRQSCTFCGAGSSTTGPAIISARFRNSRKCATTWSRWGSSGTRLSVRRFSGRRSG